MTAYELLKDALWNQFGSPSGYSNKSEAVYFGEAYRVRLAEHTIVYDDGDIVVNLVIGSESDISIPAELTTDQANAIAIECKNRCNQAAIRDYIDSCVDVDNDEVVACGFQMPDTYELRVDGFWYKRGE
jgi:hypothetical protein